MLFKELNVAPGQGADTMLTRGIARQEAGDPFLEKGFHLVSAFVTGLLGSGMGELLSNPVLQFVFEQAKDNAMGVTGGVLGDLSATDRAAIIAEI